MPDVQQAENYFLVTTGKQKFCNILVTWGRTWQLQILFLRDHKHDKLHWTVRYDQNILNHLVTVINCLHLSLNKFFFVILWHYSLILNSNCITSCTLICVAFKSHTVKQCITCQHTNYHYTINHSIFNSLNTEHMRSMRQTNIYQNIAKLLTYWSVLHCKS